MADWGDDMLQHQGKSWLSWVFGDNTYGGQKLESSDSPQSLVSEALLTLILGSQIPKDYVATAGRVFGHLKVFGQAHNRFASRLPGAIKVSECRSPKPAVCATPSQCNVANGQSNRQPQASHRNKSLGLNPHCSLSAVCPTHVRNACRATGRLASPPQAFRTVGNVAFRLCLQPRGLWPPAQLVVV